MSGDRPIEEETDRSAELIERLLGDPQLRSSFRADPAGVLRECGLGSLAEGLPPGERALLTLELRESRSSLAGVIVAAAAEGVDFGHVAEQATPRLGRHAGHALSHLVKRLGHHAKHPAHDARVAPAHPARQVPAKPDLGPAVALPRLAHPPGHHHDAAPADAVPPPPSAQDPSVPAPATPAAPTGGGHDHAGDLAAGAGDAGAAHDPLQYPGDGATTKQLAAWMGANAKRAGLPPELPVMASLTESGLRNLDYGDRDSVGFFQMRLGTWNTGAYAGFASDPQLQLKWFIDHAIDARASNPTLGDSPSGYGEWVADIERPAEQYRYRYQLQLERAQELLRGAGVSDDGGARAIVDAAAPVHHHHHERLGHAVSGTATACVGSRCRTGEHAADRAAFTGAGLVRYAYEKHGVYLPDAPAQLFEVGATVARHQLRPGDAVFFGPSGHDVREVGLYVGDGRVVIAHSHAESVSIASLSDGSLRYLGARRYSQQLLTGAASYARTLPTVKR